MTLRFLVDEDLPRSLARKLVEAGYSAEDVRDVGLRGRSDREVFEHAQQTGSVLVTADKGFGNFYRYPAASHAGVFLVRLPEQSTVADLVSRVLTALDLLQPEDFAGAIVVLQMDRMRIRRLR